MLRAIQVSIIIHTITQHSIYCNATIAYMIVYIYIYTHRERERERYVQTYNI